MARTAKFFTVILAATVLSSVFFVYQQLGAMRHAPPASVPDPRDRPNRVRRQRPLPDTSAPTVLSPETLGSEMPAMISGDLGNLRIGRRTDDGQSSGLVWPDLQGVDPAGPDATPDQGGLPGRMLPVMPPPHGR